MNESFRTGDGRTLAYRRIGRGPVLVCHPGGPGFSCSYFAENLGGLDRDFELILLDPRGTGGSDRPTDGSYSTSAYVADVEEVRAHLGVEELNLLGHSHGGVVAMAYAAELPSRVRRLVAANTLVRLHQEEMAEIMSRRRNEPWYDDARLALGEEERGEYANEAELREIARRFFPMYFARFDESAERYLEEYVAPERPNPDALREFNDGIPDWDLRPVLARISAPTLVITGEEDFICGPACADDVAQGITGSKKVVLEDCGHFTFVEAADRWREEVARFLT